jgi:hypothetical protein
MLDRTVVGKVVLTTGRGTDSRPRETR